MQSKAWVSFWFVNLLFAGLGVTRLTREEVWPVIVMVLAVFAFSAWLFMYGLLSTLCKARQSESQHQSQPHPQPEPQQPQSIKEWTRD